MPFEIIPAIDVSSGRLVTMGRAGIAPVDAFGGNPLLAARTFVEAGAARLHVVDVDLATGGYAANLAVVTAAAALGVPVQASGGVSSSEQVEAFLSAGAERVVIGSAALAFRDAVEGLLRTHGERLVIGIEADGATIRPRGRGTELGLWDTLQWLSALAVPRYLITEVGRVASLEGPDLDGVWALATHTERPVLASGGVRSVEDVVAIAGLGGSVEGVVVGRALHEGLDLRDALRAVA